MNLSTFVTKMVFVQLKSGRSWDVCTAGPSGLRPFTMPMKGADGSSAEAPVGLPFLIGEVVVLVGPLGEKVYGVKMDDQASRSPNQPNGSGRKLIVVPPEDAIEMVTYVTDDRIIT